ncbi:cupin domain-containing protein [Ureibacillus thermosphaericus]|uniref:Quercetin dioxygenase-like cupin family protein n=1 Tax=Ureibacillus thermosphaericus TaxID=51173 RepID=A0A840PUT3_URETH|nr:cupin domain-containing protein [Ureibacillus thermosphaericus]MBB5149004.1 quercetin dioxygenase-like cupin family protein [Ureibacillus thermosphaericus]NKZ31734.1 cupin domain-containing protein [Ureibacillus thermosphaericus]
MEIVTVSDIKQHDRNNVTMKTLFDKSVVDGGRTVFGIVSIPPGARIPLQGTGSHLEDEYGLVIKGSILTMSGGKEYRVVAGQATFIPHNEEHWAYNDGQDDCEIVWALVSR